ncbi:MAG: hypothetical protein CMJ25_01195 [Phycisphaerae bacterium]|nr:hypothetical protein [Phycisphaerae bacterium]|tara:strand:- start:52 stop:333 length:282 start_codon:yes stop_codon:yes gene_type:complete
MDKIQNTKDLSFYNNAILFTELLNKKVNKNIDDKELILMQTLLIDIFFYVNNLQTHLANCKVVNSKYREQRNDALLIADELREEIEWSENNQV